MKRIPATLGYEALVDDEDFERLSALKWYAHNTGDRGKSKGKRPARRTSVAEGRKVLFLVHHIIRPPKGMVVDHINGDPWDNRRCNLRVCTHAENLRNRRQHSRGCKNPFKGVYPYPRGWLARICLDNESFYLGVYKSPETAALAYDAAALALHGEFARLNFPDRGTVARRPEEIVRDQKTARQAKQRVALALLRAGKSARAAAIEVDCSVSAVCIWAKAEGLTLTRGRPRLSLSPTALASAGGAGGR